MRRIRPVFLLLAVLGLAIGLRTAAAEGNPIPPARYPELTETILNPKDQNERKGALLELSLAPRDTQAVAYGKVLGPVFLNANRTGALDEAARREMWATVIAHLADEQPGPDGEEVLLVRQFVPLLAADAELVRILREQKLLPIRGRYLGWERILRAVRLMLGDEDAKLRRAAIRVSAYCDCIDEAVTLAALYDAVKEVGTDAPGEDQTPFLDTAEILLKYSFATLSELLKFLGERAGRFETPEKRKDWGPGDKYRVRAAFLADVIDLYRSRGGEGIQRARKAALAYGQTLIAKAAGPADLLVLFDPERERFAELQRAAMAAVGPPRMTPVPDAAWATLLVSALEYSDDAAVLQRTIALIGETFTEPTKDTKLLAEAVARRLARGTAVDTLTQRRALASILGSIGLPADVRAALPERLGEGHTAQKDVWYVLIRAFGIVKDGLVIQLTPYYRVGQRTQPQWARLAVAEALGLPGFRASTVQEPLAALMLHHILTGEAVRAVKVADQGDPQKFVVRTYVGADVPEAADPGEKLLDLPAADREDDAAVITAAIDSLQFFHTEDAALVLADLAVADGAASETALKVLGRQLGRGSLPAAQALAGLLRADPALSEARLLAVLDTILQAGAVTKALPREAIVAAARSAMDTSASEAVRRKAAGVAALNADVEAVKRVYLTWNGLGQDDEARPAWAGLLQGLVVAVAKSARGAGEGAAAIDKQLAGELRQIATDDRRAFILQLFDAMGADADRFELKRIRADLRFEYADVADGRARGDRRKDLDEAQRLYRELLAKAPRGERSDLNRSIYLVLLKTAQPEWLTEGEKPEVLLLEALKVAVEIRSPELAKDALEKIAPGLAKEPGALSAAQRTELDQTTQRLRAIVDQANGK